MRPDSRHMRAGVITAAVMLFMAVLLAGATAPAQAEPPEDAVLDWNLYAVEALINVPTATPPGVGQPVPVSVLHLAMVQGAVYDAVNMIDGGHEPYLDGLPSAPASASKAAAAATAAHDVLVGMVIVPALTPAIVDEARWSPRGLPRRSNSRMARAVAAGIAAGAAAAAARCSTSGRTTSLTPLRFTAARARGGDRRPPRHPPTSTTRTPGWRSSIRS